MDKRVLAPAIFACAVLAGTACDSGGNSSTGTSTSSSSTSGGGGGGILPGTTSCNVSDGEVFVSGANGTTPYVATHGDDFAITWLNAAQTELYVAVISPSGQLVSQRTVASAPGMSQPTLYPETDGYILLWSQNDSLMGQHLDDHGAETRQAFAIQDTAVEPHLRGAPSTLGLLAAWDGASGGVLGRFGADGALQKSVSLSSAAAFPVVATDGLQAGVFWSEGNNLVFAPVTPALDLGATTTIAAKATNKGAIGYQGKFYVAWEDDALGEGSETIKLAQGGQTTSVIVPDESGSANWPGIAQGDDILGVVYYQFRDGPPSIYLSIFSSTLDRLGDDLKVSANGESDRFPSIVYGHDRFAVAYAQKDGPVKLSYVECR